MRASNLFSCFALLFVSTALLACETTGLAVDETEEDEPRDQRRTDAGIRDANSGVGGRSDGGRADIGDGVKPLRDAGEEDQEPAPVDAGSDASYPDAMPRPPTDAGIPRASASIYGHTENALFSYDPSTERVTPIGNFQPFQGEIMVDIAIDSTGRLYGGTLSRKIFRINPNNAQLTYLFDTIEYPVGLTFLPNGRLVLAGNGVVSVDPNTGAQLEVISPEGGPAASGDIIALPDGSLYMTVLEKVAGVQVEDSFARINPTTHAVTNLGTLGQRGIFGLGFANGILYGFSSTGSVFEIDYQTGTILRTLSAPGAWSGATTNPVAW